MVDHSESVPSKGYGGGIMMNPDSQEVCYISQSSQEDSSFALAGEHMAMESHAVYNRSGRGFK